jgi:hypothetical protein
MMDADTPREEYVLYDVPTGNELGRGDNPHALVSLAQQLNVQHWGLVDGDLENIMFGAETIAMPDGVSP